MSELFAYELCGLPFVSDFALPELAERQGGDAPDAIEIRMGEVPADMDDAIFRNDWVQINAAGNRVLLISPGIARDTIEGGRLITVRLPDSSSSRTNCATSGPRRAALGGCCQRKACLPPGRGITRISPASFNRFSTV